MKKTYPVLRGSSFLAALSFSFGENGGAVCLWRAFPVLSFRRSYYRYTTWPSRLRERLWWQACLSWKLLCLLLREIDFSRKAQLVQTEGGGSMFCPHLPGHCWLSIMAGCGPSLKGSGAFQIQVRSPGDYSISGNFFLVFTCLPSSFFRKLLNRNIHFLTA